MTDEQLKKLTLADVERIAATMTKAAQDIREAQALLGTPKVTRTVRPEVVLDDEPEEQPKSKKGKKGRPVIDEDAAAAHRRRQFQPVEENQPRSLAVQTDPRAQLSRAERAERERIIRGGTRAPVDANLPEDMQAAERGEPP